MSWRPRSVRLRLALSIAASLAVLLAVFSATVYGLARRHLLAEVRERVRQDIDLIDREIQEDPRETSQLEGDGVVTVYAVWKGEEPVHLSSSWSRFGLPATPIPSEDAKPRRWTTPSGRHFAIATGTVEVDSETLTFAAAEDEEPALGTLARLATIFLVALPAAILLAFAGSSILARRLLRPIAGMAEAAGRITEEHLSERLPVEDPADEFGRLALAFNQTFARIEGAFEKIRRFTSDASHELRTPLTALRSVGEGALRGALDADGYRDAIASMLEESDRLTRLVDGLLLLARENSNAYRARFAVFDLGDLAQEVVGVLRVLAEERGQELDADAERGVLVLGDRVTLRQAVFNLVDNAIKFTPQRGAIRVRVRASSAAGASGEALATLEVEDSGPGIAPEHHERIFERFYRIESDRSRASGGSGLGLSIARWAVELHGGRIGLETQEGRGSTFSVRLPRTRTSESPRASDAAA